MQIDAPELLRSIASQAEWRSLRVATGAHHDPASRSSRKLPEDDVLAGDLLLLQPQETLALPFALQVFKSAEECALPMALPHGGAEEGSSGDGGVGASLDSVRRIHVRLLNRATGEPVRSCSCASAEICV